MFLCLQVDLGEVSDEMRRAIHDGDLLPRLNANVAIRNACERQVDVYEAEEAGWVGLDDAHFGLRRPFERERIGIALQLDRVYFKLFIKNTSYVHWEHCYFGLSNQK